MRFDIRPSPMAAARGERGRRGRGRHWRGRSSHPHSVTRLHPACGFARGSACASVLPATPTPWRGCIPRAVARAVPRAPPASHARARVAAGSTPRLRLRAAVTRLRKTRDVPRADARAVALAAPSPKCPRGCARLPLRPTRHCARLSSLRDRA